MCKLENAMPDSSLSERIDRIKVKGDLLLERHAQVQAELAQARSAAGELRRELEGARREIAQLQRQLEYFKVASVLTPDHHDVESTREFITSIVRQIDKCINRLAQ